MLIAITMFEMVGQAPCIGDNDNSDAGHGNANYGLIRVKN